MINVIIADEQAVFRAGIAKVLAVEEDLRIIGQPQSVIQLTNSIEKLRTHVVIVSGSFLDDLSSFMLLAKQRNTAVLVLADHSEPATKFLQYGVQGMVYRSIASDSILDAVRHLAHGESYIQLASSLPPTANEDTVGTRVKDRLSDKEIRIMAAVVRGFKNREIAAQVSTSEQVVKNLLRNIFDKTGVSDRLELALFVLHHRTLAQATASVHLNSGLPTEISAP